MPKQDEPNPVRSRGWAFAAIVLVAFAVKLPFAAAPFKLYSDAIAYVNIAHNLACGNGFTSTLRLNYFDRRPVVHLALADWPPLYPLFAGALMRLGVTDAGLQVANALLAALAAGLVFLVACRLFDHRVGIVSGLMAAAALNLFRVSVMALSDPLGLVLALGAVLAALHAEGQSRMWLWTGVLAGLAYLTRFPNAVLTIALIGFGATGRGRARSIVGCLSGFALAAGPVLAWKWAVYGSPFYGVQSMHYTTMSFKHSSWWWYARPRPRPELDIHGIWAAMQRNAITFARDLLSSVNGLHALIFGFPLAVYGLGRTFFARGRGLALTAAFLNFAAYASTWSLPAAQGARFMLLSYCLLLPFCAAGIVWLFERPNIAAKCVAAVVCAAAVFSYCRHYPAASRAQQFAPMDRRAVDWIRNNLPKHTIVASNNPWIVSYETGLATAALPHNLGWKTFPKFVRKYRVGALVVLKTRNNSKTMRTLRAHPEWFRTTRLGTVSVNVIRSRQTPF